MKLNKIVFTSLVIGATFMSCSNDDDNTTLPVASLGDYENGIIVTEEGNFSNGNGAITFISNDLNTIEHNVYSNVNGSTLGSLVQS